MTMLAVLSWPAWPASAQAVYGSVAGSVSDSTGAGVPGARVTLRSLERNTGDTVVSGPSGYYLKERLLPGRYEARAELTGFKQVLVSSFVVSVDSQTRLDLRLEPGDVAETVTVTAAAGQLLKTDRADVATIFEKSSLTDLPVLDRNFTKLLLLTPGANLVPWQHASAENPQGSTQTMVNGQHFGGTGYQLDGTENRDPILGLIVINPNLESIAEAKITSQNYDAEFGQATAGVISVQTRSGTNEFHGSAFEFLQRDRFQARNPFTQSQPDPITARFIPETKRDQFGGSLGGPLVKDRLFAFADYQGLRSATGGSRVLTVPTLRARRGDLSEYGVAVFDPMGGDPSNREPFPGGVIPIERLSPQALAILRLIPEPNRPGLEKGTRDNYLASGSETFDEDSFDVRLDGHLRDRLNVFGRYSLADFRRDTPAAFGEGGGPTLVSAGGGAATARNQSLALGADLTLSPRMVVDLRFGFFRYRVDLRAPDFGHPSGDVGIPGLRRDELSTGLPLGSIAGPGGFEFGLPLGVTVQDEKQAQVVLNVTRLIGSHTLKLGVDVRRAYNRRVPNFPPRAGSFLFSVDRTRGPQGGGLGLASFLLGDVSVFERTASGSTDARERQWRHFYYAQDTWRATPQLTLSYGLRLEVINPQTVNAPGNGGFLDLETGEIKVAGVGGIGLDGDVRNSLNWAPRLGIAYTLGEKTVIRAGYGRSYDIGVFGSTFGHSVTQNLPVLSVQSMAPPTDFERVFNLAQGPPPPAFPAVSARGRFPLPDGVFARALPDKQRLPTLDAWNLTVQRQLTSALSAEVAYVGNKGTHVFAGDNPATDLNQATLVGYGSGPGTPGFVPRDERRPLYQKFGWTQRIDYFCNCADNRYDSLQAKLTGRLPGAFLLASYTLQRIRADDLDQFFFDRELNRGPPPWSRVHNFALATTAELPFGKGKRFLTGSSRAVDLLVGGWQLNSTAIVQSGLPFDVTYPGGADRDTGPNRPDLIGDPSGPGTRDQWFNATPIGSPGSAFGRPAVGTFGNLKRFALRGPGYWRVDASVFKSVTLGGNRRMELRVEVVNVFNHVNLDLPDAEIGTPTDPRPNAGRIGSTASFGSDPQRNLQFAVKLSF